MIRDIFRDDSGPNNSKSMDYAIKVKCTNCGYEDIIEIPEGMKVEEYLCPRCKTKSLVPVIEEEEKIEKEEGEK